MNEKKFKGLLETLHGKKVKSPMSSLKVHVLLKQLKRGVLPPADVLDEAIIFIEAQYRTVKRK